MDWIEKEADMRYFIISDLEGAVGVEKFEITRSHDSNIKEKAMRQLTREMNACVAGIKSAQNDAIVDVIDGHGNGGIIVKELENCDLIDFRQEHPRYIQENMNLYDGIFFIGQHAMSGTIDAVLCHTYSSLTIDYYKLNGVFIGEFAARSALCGVQGAPVIFISGDDKAVAEAKMFIPEIKSVITKHGTGRESGIHRDSEVICKEIKERAEEAVLNLDKYSPYTRFKAPFIFEARYLKPLSDNFKNRENLQVIDERTYRIETDDITELPF